MIKKIQNIDIAIPLYNEENSISNLKEHLIDLEIKLSKLNIQYNIFFVDDGSSDNTYKKLVENFDLNKTHKIIRHEDNLNLNGFLKTMQKEVKSDYVVFLDCDCTFSPVLIVDMLNNIKEETDIMNGSPYHPEGNIMGVNPIRLVISKIANTVYKYLVDENIYTYTSIFKMYKSTVFKNIKINGIGFVSVAELFIKAILKGAIVQEFPCTLTIRTTGDSKIKIMNSIRSHIKLMGSIIVKKINQ